MPDDPNAAPAGGTTSAPAPTADASAQAPATAASGGDATPATPAPQANGAAPAPDPLVPGYTEKQELDRFLTRGHQTHSTIMLLTFLGVMLFLGAMLYWRAFDYSRDAAGKWTPFVARAAGAPAILDFSLKNQIRKDQAAYQVRPGAAPRVPTWPRAMYDKLRFDIYLIGGVVFLLALIAVKIEGSKAHRRELLVLRALLRESEKQRLTIAELEKKLKNGGEGQA